MNFLWMIKTESYKRGILLSVIFNIIAKGILFLLTIFIAGFFGSNIKTDIYFFVYGEMVLLSGFISAVDTAVLIPQSMQLREKEGADQAMALLNYFFYIYFLIGILFVAIMFLFGTTIFELVSKFSATDIQLYRNYFLAGSIYFLFMLLTNFANAILTSLKFFTIPMIISGINSCIVIASILLLHRQLNVLSVFIGGIAAYSFNLVLLIVVMKKKAGWNFFIAAAPKQKKIWSNIGYTQMGQLATFASSFFPLFLLSGFGNGAISVMNYGKNIADIPNTLVTAQLANVNGIKLNEQFARHDETGMNDTFITSSRLLVFILVPLSCFMFVFAQPIVELFYKRGIFTEAAVMSSAVFLQLFSISIFSIGINAVVTRIFNAMQAIKQAFIYQVVLNIVLIIAIWLFTKQYGAYGYPYGIILINMVNFIGMYFICKKIFKSITYSSLLSYSAMVIALNLPVAVLLFYMQSASGLGSFYKLILGFCIYLFAVLLMSRIKKISTGY